MDSFIKVTKIVEKVINYVKMKEKHTYKWFLQIFVKKSENIIVLSYNEKKRGAGGHEMDYTYSSKIIKNLRIRQGYTVEQLAEEVDISTKFLYEIEAGKKGFSAGVLYKISRALNVSCDYILTNNKQRVISDLIVELVKKLDNKEQMAVEHILLEILKLKKK